MNSRKVCAAALMASVGVAAYCIAAAHADPSKATDRLPMQVSAAAGLERTAGAPAGGPGLPADPAGLPHRFPPPPPGPAGLSGMLSAAETAIGIRADQLDAWRDYTDALLAIAPPAPPKPGAEADEAAKPFARPLALAERLKEDGKKAEALLVAIDKLKARLTPAQLERVARFEATLPPPGFMGPGMPPHGAPPPGGPPPFPPPQRG